MLEWEALVGDALPVAERGDGGVIFHGGVLSKARNTKYSWAIERSSGVHGFWTLLNACPEY